MTSPHEPQTPDMVAWADRMHARGRDLLTEMLDSVREHEAVCPDIAACTQPVNEARNVADCAVELFKSITDCGPPECVVENLKVLCEALAYTAVRTVAGRPLTQEVPDHA